MTQTLRKAGEIVKALLIDGLNLVRRIFAAVPEGSDPPTHVKGVVASVSASLERALLQHEPSHAVCIFYGEGRSWRHDLYPAYKSERLPMPVLLRDALAEIKLAIEQLGVGCIARPGYEADDLLATMAVKISERSGWVVILSTDTSLCQMLTRRIRIHDHFAGRDLDTRYVQARFGVGSEQLCDLLSLVGSQSASIPGIKGIGVKTAARLIGEYGTLDALLTRAEAIPGRPGRLIRESRELALLSQRLVSMRTDVLLGANLAEFRLEKGGRNPG